MKGKSRSQQQVRLRSSRGLLVDVETRGDMAVSAARTPGTGVFLSSSSRHTPRSFEVFLARGHSLPEVLIFLKVSASPLPYVEKHAMRMIAHGEQIYTISLSVGFGEDDVDVFEVLQRATSFFGLPSCEVQSVSVFTWSEAIMLRPAGSWYRWLWRLPLLGYQHLKQMFPERIAHVHINPSMCMIIGMIAEL